MFRRENLESEQPRQAKPSATARVVKQQRGWQANEPNEELRSVWGAHRTAKIALLVTFVLACVAIGIYVFTSRP